MQAPRKLSENSPTEIYKQIHSKNFRKKLKKHQRSGRGEIALIKKLVLELMMGKTLDLKYQDHQLHGSLQSFRECHVTPNLLLIYFINETEKELHLVDVGTHPELFG